MLREKIISYHQAVNTFEFIKVVSDTVFDMINAAYRDKPLIFIGAMFREKLAFHHHEVNVAPIKILS